MKNILLKTLTHALALTFGLYIGSQLIATPIYVDYTGTIPVRYHEPININMWTFKKLQHKA